MPIGIGIKRAAKGVLATVVLTALLATPALAAPITNVAFVPPSPASFAYGELLNFTFDYDIPQDSRIWGRPFFNGSLRPDYAAHGSGIYSAGTGSGSGWFTIGDVGQGLAPVDQVRFEIYDPNSGLSDYAFLDVDFVWGPAKAVPEPGTLALLSTGLGWLSLTAFRRRRNVAVASNHRS